MARTHSMNRKKLTIDEMKALAESKGGQCLSNQYVNNTTPLTWQCSKGHKWDARPVEIKNLNTWCPHCSGRRKTIQDMRKFAESKGGKCLSGKYINNDTKLLWECHRGHRWTAKPFSIIHLKSWCPFCYQIRNKMNRKLRPKRKRNLIFSKLYLEV